MTTHDAENTNMPLSRLALIAAGVLAAAVLVVPLPGEDPPLHAGSRSAAPVISTPPATTAPVKRLTSAGFPSYVATLKGEIDARSQPSDAASVVAHLRPQTEHGEPQTVLVNDEMDRGATPWLEVLLPVRPNGTTGWIRGDTVDVRGVNYELDVHLQEFRLDVLMRGSVVRNIRIGVGKNDTPTPGGVFYVNELLQPPNPGGPYGTHAYVLNGYSNVLTDFNGGNGVIGIHGTDHPELIGQQVSHGCIRMANADIDSLAPLLPLGTPVRVLT